MVKDASNYFHVNVSPIFISFKDLSNILNDLSIEESSTESLSSPLSQNNTNDNFQEKLSSIKDQEELLKLSFVFQSAMEMPIFVNQY